MLLASKARFDFRFSKKDNSAGASLGDSYTLGMAGTGGTSSSPSAVVELSKLRDLGAGNLEPPDALRGCIEPVDVRTVLKLVVEPTDSPELYDFRFGSGVVREEDGVEILRGSIEGDREEARTSVATGSGFAEVWGVTWPDGGCIDIRFIRLVSVGLMVLAPSPVACVAWGTPGMTDIRFPEGVFPPLAATRGDRGWDMDRLLWSTERTLVSGESMDWLARGGGCTDLALDARAPVRVRVVSPMGREPPSIDERVESRPFLSAPVAMLVLRFRES